MHVKQSGWRAEYLQLAFGYQSSVSISPEEVRPVPEQIKIINKTNVMDFAGGLEPGVEAEDSAKPPSSMGSYREGATDKKSYHNFSEG